MYIWQPILVFYYSSDLPTLQIIYQAAIIIYYVDLHACSILTVDSQPSIYRISGFTITISSCTDEVSLTNLQFLSGNCSVTERYREPYILTRVVSHQTKVFKYIVPHIPVSISSLMNFLSVMLIIVVEFVVCVLTYLVCHAIAN